MKMTRIRTIAAIAGFAIVLANGAAMAADGDEVIAAEGTIGNAWALDGDLATAAYPAGLASHGDDVCIALGYRIGRDGSTSEFRVLDQWNSTAGRVEPTAGYWQAFAQASADAVSQWHFQPRPGIGEAAPTTTVATIVFRTGNAGDPVATREHCAIADLPQRIALVERGKSLEERDRRYFQPRPVAARTSRDGYENLVLIRASLKR